MSSFIDEIAEKVRQHPRLVIAEDYELAIQELASEQRRYQDGAPVAVTREAHHWVSLRILHRKQPGRAILKGDIGGGIAQLVEEAFESSQRSSPDPWFRFPIWKARRAESPRVPSEVESLTSLHSQLPSAPDFLEETYETSDIYTRILRKTERQHRDFRCRVNGAQFAVWVKAEGDVFALREKRAHTAPLVGRERWLANLLAQSREQRTSRSFTGATSNPHRLTALLAPSVVASFLEAMAPWFFGDRIQEGKTPFGPLSNSPLFSNVITLIDDGLLPGGANTSPFDLEGSSAQETIVVEKGAFRQPLFDTYTATRDNRLSTGNFLKAPRDTQPHIGISNFYVKPSATGVAELVSAIAGGVVIESLDRFEVTKDPLVVSLSGRGWRAEAGRPVEPLRDIQFRCRIADVLRHAVGVGNDLTFYGAAGAPSILCEDLPLEV